VACFVKSEWQRSGYWYHFLYLFSYKFIQVFTDVWGWYANTAARLESGLPDTAYCHDELEASPYRHFRVICIEDIQIRVWSRPRVVSSYEATAIVNLTLEGKLSKSAVGELGGYYPYTTLFVVRVKNAGSLVFLSSGSPIAVSSRTERVWRCPYGLLTVRTRNVCSILYLSMLLSDCGWSSCRFGVPFFSSYWLKICSSRRNCVDWRMYVWSEIDRYITGAPYRLVNYSVCRRDVCVSRRYGSACCLLDFLVTAMGRVSLYLSWPPLSTAVFVRLLM